MNSDVRDKTKVRWKRLRDMIRRRDDQTARVNLYYGRISGVDCAVNYINGYMAASKGKAVNDWSGGDLLGASIDCVWWRRGWHDFTDGKSADPYGFAMEKYPGPVLS